METWATDGIETCLLNESEDIRKMAATLLDTIYGSANATPGPDSGRNTPRPS